MSDYTGMSVELTTSNCTVTTQTSVKPHLGLFYCEFTFAIPPPNSRNSNGIILNNDDDREERAPEESRNTDNPDDAGLSIGLSKSYGGTARPGWSKDSVGYSSSDGWVYVNTTPKLYCRRYGSGDTVGLLVSFIDKTLAFTVNGTLLPPVDFLVHGMLRLQVGSKSPCSLLVVPQESFVFDISQHFTELVSNCATQMRRSWNEERLDVAHFLAKNWERRRERDLIPSVLFGDVAFLLAREMLESPTDHETDWRENVLDCMGHGDTRSAIRAILEHGGTAPLGRQESLCPLHLPRAFPLAITQPLLDPVRALVFGVEGEGEGGDGGGSSKTPLTARLTVNSPRLARLFLEAALTLSRREGETSVARPYDPDPVQMKLLKLEALGLLCGALDVM